MSYIITEKLTSTLVVWMIMKRVTRGWSKWNAAKNGIISPVDGKRLRKPRTAKERESWDILDRFAWSLKRILTKFHGDNKLAYLFSLAYLMKENYVHTFNTNLDRYKEELEELTLTEQKLYYEVISKIETSNIISENHLDLETNALKIKDNIQHILESYNLFVTPVLSIVEDMEGGSTSLGDFSQYTPPININKVKRRIKLRRKKCQKQPTMN